MLNERKLTKAELNKREDIVKDMKKNKRALVKKYGKDAEKVMYGRATKMAKKQNENQNMEQTKHNLRKMIEDALKNPKKADLNKDGKLSSYEKKRGAAVEKSMEEGIEKIKTAKQNGDKSYTVKYKDGTIKKIYVSHDDWDDIHAEYGEKSIEKKTLKEGIPTDLEPLAFDILHRSLRNRYITIEEATDESVIGVAREVAGDHADDEEIGSSDMTFIIKEFLDGIGKKTGFENGRLTVSENVLNENKQEAFNELQEIMDQLYELSDRAKQIIRSEFPSEYSRLDAYGALNFGTSSNRYDVTFEKALENLDMEDDDMDMMQEDLDLVHVYDVDGKMYGTGERISNKGDKTLVRFDGATEKEFPSSQVKNVSEDLDLGHQDDEPGMLKGDLYKIGKYSMELYQMMDSLEGQGEVDFPHWWQSKIITAKNMISGAKHYLDFELKEPQIDAVVDLNEEAINSDYKYIYKKIVQKYPDVVGNWDLIKSFVDDEISNIEITDTQDMLSKFEEYRRKKFKGVISKMIGRDVNEGMSEEEWAKSKEEDRLAKLPTDQQAKIKKAIAMLKAEKKSKK